MTDVNLVTYPDIVSTGFQVVLINIDPEQQVYIGNMLLDLLEPTNVYQIDLEVNDHLQYNLSVIKQADVIIFNKPNMWHWMTGVVLSSPNCFFLETDSGTVNTLNKLTLRHAKLDSLQGTITNALKRKQKQQAHL